jgi:hypothetical protein
VAVSARYGGGGIGNLAGRRRRRRINGHLSAANYPAAAKLLGVAVAKKLASAAWRR